MFNLDGLNQPDYSVLNLDPSFFQSESDISDQNRLTQEIQGNFKILSDLVFQSNTHKEKRLLESPPYISISNIGKPNVYHGRHFDSAISHWIADVFKRRAIDFQNYSANANHLLSLISNDFLSQPNWQQLEEKIKNLVLCEYIQDISGFMRILKTIQNLEPKADQLIKIIRDSDWDNTLLDRKLEDAQARSECKEFDYETPWVGLYALACGKITIDDFFILQQYFALRHQFPKDKIIIVKPQNEADSLWRDMLELALSKNKNRTNLNNNRILFPYLDENNFNSYLDKIQISYKENPGRGVLFGVLQEKEICRSKGYNYTMGAEAPIWEGSRLAACNLFSYPNGSTFLGVVVKWTPCVRPKSV